MSEHKADIMFVFEEEKIHVFKIAENNTIERIKCRGEDYFECYIEEFNEYYKDCVKYVKNTKKIIPNKVAGVFVILDNNIDYNKIIELNKELCFTANYDLYDSIVNTIKKIYQINVNLKRSNTICKYYEQYYLFNSKSQNVDLIPEDKVRKVIKGKKQLDLDPYLIAERILVNDKVHAQPIRSKENNTNRNEGRNPLQTLIGKKGKMRW